MTEKIENIINNTTRIVELKAESQTYQAGVCNIGNGEREKRRKLAIFGGMFATAWPFLGFVFVFPIWLKLLVFVFAFVGILDLFQYRQQFCAYFGLTSQFRISDAAGPYKVVDQRDQILDQEKSNKMIMKSLVISLVYTLLVVVLF